MNKLIVFVATFFAFAQLMVASSLPQDIDCSNLQLMVTSSSESSLNMVYNPYSGIDIISQNWIAYSTDGDFIVSSINVDLSNIYLGDNISLFDSIEVCLEVTDINQESCEVCDTLFYNGPINEWISINSPDINYEIDCDSVEVFIFSESENEVLMGSNVYDFEGLLSYYWVISDNNGNSLSANSIVDLSESETDTIVSCLTTIDEYNVNCQICETLAWDGYNWHIFEGADEPILSVESVMHTDTAEYGSSFPVFLNLVNNDDGVLEEDIILNFFAYSEQQMELPDTASFTIDLNATNGIGPGESIPLSINIPVNLQTFQYSGDNLVVIWPSVVSPVLTDTSITTIYIKDGPASINPIPIDNSFTQGYYYDLLGKEYKSWNDIPKGTIYLREGRKYLKF